MEQRINEIIKYYDDFSSKWNLEPIHQKYVFDEIRNGDVRLQLSIYHHSAEAPVLIFIPGTSTYSMLFSQLLYAIHLSGYNVIGFDPRGHGLSQGEKGDYTFGEIVEDTLAVVDYAYQKYNNQLAILGCSQGGIAAFYAAQQDARIQTIICQPFADLGSRGVFKLTPAPKLFSILSKYGKTFADSFPNTKIPVSTYLRLEKTKVPYYGNVKKYIEQDPYAISHVRLKTLQSLSDTKLPKPIEDFRTPICVLHAGRDRIFPLAYVQYLYDKLNCPKDLVIFNGLQHVMFIEKPERIAKEVVIWLQKIFK